MGGASDRIAAMHCAGLHSPVLPEGVSVRLVPGSSHSPPCASSSAVRGPGGKLRRNSKKGQSLSKKAQKAADKLAAMP